MEYLIAYFEGFLIGAVIAVHLILIDYLVRATYNWLKYDVAGKRKVLVKDTSAFEMTVLPIGQLASRYRDAEGRFIPGKYHNHGPEFKETTHSKGAVPKLMYWETPPMPQNYTPIKRTKDLSTLEGDNEDGC